jgi:hypothetical protein
MSGIPPISTVSVGQTRRTTNPDQNRTEVDAAKG